MQIRQFNEATDALKVAKLWNKVVAVEDFFYQYSEEDYCNIVFKNKHFQSEGATVALDGENLVGFAVGFVRVEDREKEDRIGYFNLIFVDPDYRRQGIGHQLMQPIYEWFKASGCKAIRSFYASPINFPWYIPHTDHHNHPGMPAIRINSSEYFFMLSEGFYMQGQIDAFHLNLCDYEMPEAVAKRKAENEKRGITVGVYDPEKHYGVEEFCQKIEDTGNGGFAHAIRYNMNREKPYPFICAAENGKMVGWTGPMYTESTGRGHLDGICVDPDVRGGGIGKCVFCELCNYSKAQGSKFMTFFTGLENPARYMYLGAGFKIVQSFAIMKRDL